MPSPFTDALIDPREFFSLFSRVQFFSVLLLAMSSMAKADNTHRDPFQCDGGSLSALTLPEEGASFCFRSTGNSTTTFSFFVQPNPKTSIFSPETTILDCYPHSPGQWLADAAHHGVEGFNPVPCPDEALTPDFYGEMLRTCADLNTTLSHIASEHPDNQTLSQAHHIFNDFFDQTKCDNKGDGDVLYLLGGLGLFVSAAYCCFAYSMELKEKSSGDGCFRELGRALSDSLSTIVDLVSSCLQPQKGCCPRISAV